MKSTVTFKILNARFALIEIAGKTIPVSGPDLYALTRAIPRIRRGLQREKKKNHATKS